MLPLLCHDEVCLQMVCAPVSSNSPNWGRGYMPFHLRTELFEQFFNSFSNSKPLLVRQLQAINPGVSSSGYESSLPSLVLLS
jgi:hypothetical protein